ncbi:MAG: hypothetical protein Q8K55_00855 [Gemmatimonadaceae bacterium]|nr:hypothetical protein [Gemmatimonadaceae bacterium]
MNDTNLRARSVSDIVDAAFALYRRHSGQYILVVALAHVPTLILQIVIQGSQPPGSMPSLPYSLLIMAVSLVTFSFMSGMVMLMGSQAYLGGEPDIGAATTTVLARFRRLLPATLLMWIAYAVGLVCLLVGALYVAARFFAVEAVVVLENRNAADAFGRSSTLSDGRKGHVLSTLLLVYVIYFLLLMGASWMANLAGSQVVSIMVSSAVTIVVYPVLKLTTMVLYYDMRIRHEGFDLERMERALESPMRSTAVDA